MKKLEKIIVGLCINSFLITGCSLSGTWPLLKEKNIKYDETSLSYSNGDIINQEVTGSDKAQKMLYYLEFFDKYGYRDRELIKSLEDKDYRQLEIKLKRFAEDLEKDSNPFALEYLDELKNFKCYIEIGWNYKQIIEFQPYSGTRKLIGK